MPQPITFRIATAADIPPIQQIAENTWAHTYQTVISAEQIAFMYEKMYTAAAIAEQMQNGHTFVLAYAENVLVGFVSFSCTDAAEKRWKIHKLYFLPSQQKKGMGSQLIGEVRRLLVAENAQILELNVNRNNSAVGFYTKYGFRIAQTVDIPYFQFVLNDYVMELDLP